MVWLYFVIFLGACLAAGATGAIFPPGPWYRSLDKPRWTPPNWLFPVAWTTIYICMAAAGARAAISGQGTLALVLWSLQIALNGLWTPVFFGLRNIRGGMLVLSLLWLSVAVTMLALWQADWIAGLLFLPYLGWVSVAGALNLSVLRRNPETAANPPKLER
ncbi:tryptophan-rich sensory protein [Lutimaribacter sp. EGI FJ00015]|uniref:Tryptophan-rich sensory protein n=1 Tax=Lutimaribacter degradans TaxID=2945989 RepID=A0ACC5ZUR4_9RHOB|nr:TspO/MBR family protein [Lutimaribacter sp. EGI FJ00013]MCM2562031.1 tryptophan-rich sensory protein [Lutimaribacter sp. EGI FJ00013]MCO0612937.1 tryptophan-rich sensory protein [Lutimaribacter sp. EGI FJ00015]MCO0635863.1 tryptophan-rich sensory protein [Lutimaribacter sp. EGI FJ00014]